MAVVSSLLTFGLLSFLGKDDKPDYGCVEYDMNDERNKKCFPLLLNDETYWSGVSDEWAQTVQTGAAFGILAVVLGIIAWAMLLSSTCLELQARRLWIIRLLLLLATVMGLLTLIAVAADVCDYALSGNVAANSKCDTKRFRLGYGGIAMMIGSGLHLLALVATMGFIKCGSSMAAVPPRQPMVEKQESAPMDIEGTA
jgi:hypothetical protein